MRGRTMQIFVSASLAVVIAAACPAVLAHGGGGSHGGGGGHRGGGRHGSWRGGHGYRHGWYGGWGLDYGFLLASLPWYYDTYWWDGAPYYYADDEFYQWNSSEGEYQTVPPPARLADHVKAQAAVHRELFVYPKGGQSPQQQASDRAECHLWAVTETGFDPTAAPDAPEITAYLSAERACLEGRNYTVG